MVITFLSLWGHRASASRARGRLGWAEHILEFWIKYVVRSLIQNRKSKILFGPAQTVPGTACAGAMTPQVQKGNYHIERAL